MAEVELSENEMDRVRELVKANQWDVEKCGLLLFLEKGDKELYENVAETVYGVVYEFFSLHGLQIFYLDLDEQMETNYKRDKEEDIMDDY